MLQCWPSRVVVTKALSIPTPHNICSLLEKVRWAFKQKPAFSKRAWALSKNCSANRFSTCATCSPLLRRFFFQMAHQLIINSLEWLSLLLCEYYLLFSLSVQVWGAWQMERLSWPEMWLLLVLLVITFAVMSGSCECRTQCRLQKIVLAIKHLLCRCFERTVGQGLAASSQKFTLTTEHEQSISCECQDETRKQRWIDSQLDAEFSIQEFQLLSMFSKALAQEAYSSKANCFTSNNGCWCWNIILLAGSQSLWLQKYRHLPKVTAAFDRGERFVVANLLQNPLTFPLCSVYLPTLLRNGKMWLISQSGNQEVERYMLPEEHLQAMAIPQFADCAGQEPFPHIRCPLTGTQKKSLAGNASRLDLADILVLSAMQAVITNKAQ